MNRALKALFLLIFPAVVLLSGCAGSRTSGQSTESMVQSGKWLDGLQLQPHASINQQQLADQYQKHPQWWNTAIAWLKNTNLEQVAPGKYNLLGDTVYVSVTEGPSKEFAASNWESHRHYIDLQYVAQGKEKIGTAPAASLTVTNPYIPAKDVANYTGEGTYYIADPSTFFLFFPGDAHRPGIKVDGYDTVKKVVVKIRYAE